MQTSILDEFPLPEEAMADLRGKRLNETRLQEGVSLLTSGHDRGLSYRFFVHQERNAVKSEATNFPHFDEIDMIEWYRDSQNRITERVKELPVELLKFDKFDGSCIGGLYKEAYDRFKQGLSAPGLPLRRWNILAEGEVKALEEFGIFTVEQFASLDRNRVASRFPTEFQKAHQQAIEYVNGKDTREQASKQAQQLMDVMNENAKLNAEMEALKEQFQALLVGQAPEVETKSKKRGKK